MKITVAGLWHLGCVTSACCARHFDVVGFDEDSAITEELNRGKAPVFEPGLDEAIRQGVSTGRLRYSADRASACADADVLWVTYDTPVNENDEADVDFVLDQIRKCLPELPPHAIVLISSQVPVGTCRRMEEEFEGVVFAYSPENLQLGKAIVAFESAARTIVGLRGSPGRVLLEELLSPFCQQILWMRTESAEMVKHSLNAFLGLSIAYINEIAALCEETKADAKEVSMGLKSDPRIGPRAYLSAGGAFAGGTLARDIVSLTDLGKRQGIPLHVIPAIQRSNESHKSWALRKLRERFDLRGTRIGLLGLTYKPGTNTLRRSLALELARSLQLEGASVVAFDPVIGSLAGEGIELKKRAAEAAEGAHALLLCTEWPELRDVDWATAIATMNRRLVLDPNRFLEKEFEEIKVEYLSVGRV